MSSEAEMWTSPTKTRLVRPSTSAARFSNLISHLSARAQVCKRPQRQRAHNAILTYYPVQHGHTMIVSTVPRMTQQTSWVGFSALLSQPVELKNPWHGLKD
eukprot:6024736-Amphidinium_carterae.1